MFLVVTRQAPASGPFHMMFLLQINFILKIIHRAFFRSFINCFPNFFLVFYQITLFSKSFWDAVYKILNHHSLYFEVSILLHFSLQHLAPTLYVFFLFIYSFVYSWEEYSKRAYSFVCLLTHIFQHLKQTRKRCSINSC